MAVLGFDDDVWFGLQSNAQHGFSQSNIINMGFNSPNCVTNDHTNQGFFNIHNYYYNNNNNNLVFPSSSTYEAFPHQPNLDAQLESQRQEIDYILHLQNEKLRNALHEQRKQQLSSLINSLETKATSLIKQKDDDLARATRKGIELQERLRRVETESQAWQRIARAKEAAVMELNNALQQALVIGNDDAISNVNDNNYNNINRAEDAESTCFVSSEELVHGRSGNDNKLVCKVCKSRSSCVVFLPCKHLCSCKACEAFLGCCPVCESVKETSFEVFLV